MAISFKACPRCSGDVITRPTDIILDDPYCIQCGYRLAPSINTTDALGVKLDAIRIEATKTKEPTAKENTRTLAQTVFFSPIVQKTETFKFRGKYDSNNYNSTNKEDN